MLSLHLLKQGPCKLQLHHLLKHKDLNWGQVSDNYRAIRKLVIIIHFRAAYSGIFQKQSRSDRGWVCWGVGKEIIICNYQKGSTTVVMNKCESIILIKLFIGCNHYSNISLENLRFPKCCASVREFMASEGVQHLNPR